MIVKIPRQIRIGAHRYSISLDPTLEERHKKIGFADITNGLILIESRAMDTAKTDILIHEILHIVDFYYCNKVLTEEQITAITTGLLNILDGFGVEFVW